MKSAWYTLRFIGDEGRVEDHFVADVKGFNEVDDLLLQRAEVIRNWPSTAFLRSSTPESDGHAEDVLANTFALLVFSERLRNSLADCGIASNDVQFLPVNVFTSASVEIKGYAIANITSVCDALDREHSTYISDVARVESGSKYQGKDDANLWKAALIASELDGHDIVRIKGCGHRVYASARFHDTYMRRKLTGASFAAVRCY